MGQISREDAVKAFLASKGLLDSFMKFDRSKVVKASKDGMIPFPSDLVTLTQSVSVSIISKALIKSGESTDE
jgi:hypothetical protein